MRSLFVGGMRPGGRPTFVLGPIPVRVEFSFWLMGVLLGFDGFQSGSGTFLGIWLAALFVSVLFHEMGHAICYRLYGARSEVLLYAGGGLTRGERERAFSTGEQIVVALAGPGAGLLLGFAVLALAHLHGPFASKTAGFAITQLLWINLAWSLFNLLPIVPMDGGHVLESLLCLKDKVRGRIWARWVSIAVCAGLAPLAWKLGDAWATMLLLLFALQAFQTLALVDPKRQARMVPAPVPESPGVIEDLERMHKLLSEDRPQEARAVAFQVIDRARAPGARDAALRALAWLAIGEGQPAQAVQHLSQTSPQFDDPFTWGTAIAASGDAQGALPHLARAHARGPTPPVVAAYARCLLATQRRDEALALAGPESAADVQRALQEALFRSHDFAGAAEVAKRLYARTRDPSDAYNVACAHARKGESGQAIEWLHLALDAGFRDTEHLSSDPDLASLRLLPDFQALLGQLSLHASTS